MEEARKSQSVFQYSEISDPYLGTRVALYFAYHVPATDEQIYV
jgi:hypothetical protein